MMMTTTNQNSLAQSYNELPYTSGVFAQSQPTHLHAIAKIRGLEPAPLETAKVLEIGCSFGGNLLPHAIHYPNSQIVGIDLSEHQINIGKQMMQMIGVENVELVAADISQVSFNIQFDYIICHGVFSWVPESVKQAILKTIQTYLSPNGIAYISYNVYPGWKTKEIIKDLMQFGSDQNASKLERADQAIELLKLTQGIFEGKEILHGNFLKRISDQIIELPKYYIAHEYFEDYNQPLYFSEFVNNIHQYGLGYITNSDAPAITRQNYSLDNDKYERICQLNHNRLENVEQMLDFITHNTFRKSLITHQQNLNAHGIQNNIEQHGYLYHCNEIFLRSSPQFVEENNGKKAHWKFEEKAEFISTPLNDAIFTYLNEQNSAVKVKDIIEQVKQRSDFDEENIRSVIVFLICSCTAYLSFFPEGESRYGKKPMMPEKYRNFIQIVRNNPDIVRLSNRYYETVELDFFQQYLSQYLDGTKTIKQLAKQCRQDIKNGVIKTKKEISDKELEEFIILNLNIFQKQGYFIPV